MTPEPHSQQSSKPNLRTTMWRNARVWKAEACSRIFSEQRTVLCTHLRFWPTSRAAPLLHTLPAMLGSQSCTQRTDDRWRQKALRDVQAAEEGVGTGTSVIYTRKAKWNPNRDWGVRASSPSRETRDRPFGFNSRLWISGHHEVVAVFQVNRHKSFAVLATSRCTRSPLKESVAWNCSFSMIPWPDGAVLLVLSGLILEAVVVCRVSQWAGLHGDDLAPFSVRSFTQHGGPAQSQCGRSLQARGYWKAGFPRGCYCCSLPYILDFASH